MSNHTILGFLCLNSGGGGLEDCIDRRGNSSEGVSCLCAKCNTSGSHQLWGTWVTDSGQLSLSKSPDFPGPRGEVTTTLLYQAGALAGSSFLSSANQNIPLMTL